MLDRELRTLRWATAWANPPWTLKCQVCLTLVVPEVRVLR